MASTRPLLDKVYFVYFLIHIPILFCVDLVPLYPASLWAGPSAPLGVLSDLRSYYFRTYNDRFFAPPSSASPPPPSFFVLFSWLELLFHLPVSAWAVRALSPLSSSSSAPGGAAELLLLVYGVETALTTATCMWEAYLWDPAVVTAGQKAMLLGPLYGSYLALAVLLTVDMYTRLLKRVGDGDNAGKTAAAAKKTQ
ncbi:transmembrane protein 6/97 [Biscogniauxia mediterranea]|nr:transmembrane protein 6/97 [Biscogniauxia mediterranea]